jgi:trans-aconitate 2-methyltransferase
MTWSSQQYLKFEDERTRPAHDLLQAVPTLRVTCAADLGCGPGNSTELLVEHYPDATVVGIDNSPDMIEAAQKRLPYIKFRLGSIEEWNEPGPWDLLFANAVFQWIGHHDILLKRLTERLAQGGSLAFQMPDNVNEPTHVAMREAARAAPFAAKLRKAAKARKALEGVDWYYTLLKPLVSHVDIWKTTYYHPLAGGVDAIVEWVRGTGLIPFLKPLSEEEQAVYLAAYREELAKAYKPLDDGAVILPFPRLFVVATR